jgi:hypothetical protein
VKLFFNYAQLRLYFIYLFYFIFIYVIELFNQYILHNYIIIRKENLKLKLKLNLKLK